MVNGNIISPALFIIPKFHSTFYINSTAETVLTPADQRRADLCQGGDTGQTGPGRHEDPHQSAWPSR